MKFVMKHDLISINEISVYVISINKIMWNLFCLSDPQYVYLAKSVDGCLKLYDLIGCRSQLSRHLLKEILLETDFSEVNQPVNKTISTPCKCIKCGYDNPYNEVTPYICSSCKLWESMT